MGLLDNLISQAVDAGTNAAKRAVNQALSDAKTSAEKAVTNAINNKTVTFSWPALPATLEEFRALPEAAMQTPYQTAALTVVALAVYAQNPAVGKAMLDFLNGPADFGEYDRQFLEERLGGKEYLPRSYFRGATPENNYTPKVPYTVDAKSNANSFSEENYATMWFTSGGADSDREIKLRRKPSTGTWYLWEQFLLSDIRIPAEADPWA